MNYAEDAQTLNDALGVPVAVLESPLIHNERKYVFVLELGEKRLTASVARRLIVGELGEGCAISTEIDGKWYVLMTTEAMKLTERPLMKLMIADTIELSNLNSKYGDDPDKLASLIRDTVDVRITGPVDMSKVRTTLRDDEKLPPLV